MAKKSKLNLYWPPAVTVDVVIFTIKDGSLRVLLIKRADKPFANKLALPGGFLLKGETAEEAAKRILKEKAGVSKVYLEQLYTFDSPLRDPRGHVMTVAHFALVNENKIKFLGGNDIQMPTFHKTEKLPTLAFDHKKIIDYAIRRLRYKLEYTNVIYSLMPSVFTLGQLQKAHEIILARDLDKRNFRKKFLSLGLIKPTKAQLIGIRQRPAQLYAFAEKNPLELKRFL